MKKFTVVLFAAMIGLFLAACSCPYASCPAGGSGACAVKGETLCAKCGEVKGTEKCCAKDAVKCSKCDKIKGSPGCCKPAAVTAECPKKKGCCPKKAAACPTKK